MRKQQTKSARPGVPTSWRPGSPAACPTAGSPARPTCRVDRDEILVVGAARRARRWRRTPTPTPARAALRGPHRRASARTPASARMRIADEAERRFGRKVAWGATLRRRRGGVHQPERPGHDPPAHARAPGARHARRRRRRPQPQRRARLVRAPRARARGRVDRPAARRARPRRAGARATAPLPEPRRAAHSLGACRPTRSSAPSS